MPSVTIQSVTGHRRRVSWLTAVLLLFGLAVNALPIVQPVYLQTQDGGAHYNTAMVLAGLGSDANSFFEQYFEPRPQPPATQLASSIMAQLAELGFGRHAERILWVLLFAGFSAIVVVNLQLLQYEAAPFAVLLFPLFAGVLVNLGFLNYLIGFALFNQGVFVLHFGLRRPSVAWLIGLLAVSVCTYLAHPLAAFALAATAGPLGLVVLLQRRAGPSLLFPIGCALVCTVLTCLVARDAWPQIASLFVGGGPATADLHLSPPPVSDTFRERLIFVFGLSYFVSYAPADYLFSAGFAVVLVWLGWRWLRQFRQGENLWLAPVATLLALSLLLPRRIEYFLPERIIPCLLAVLLIWWARTPLSRPASRVLLAAGVLLNVGLLLWRLHWGAMIDGVLREYASIAPSIPERTSLLSIETAPSYLQLDCRAVRPRVLPCNFRPTLHFVGELLGDRAVALLTNYQLQPQTGFFPLGLRGPWSGYTDQIGHFERWPPLPQYAPKIVGDVERLIALEPPDVIVTWDDRRATGGPAALVPDALQPLLAHYTQVFTSRPLGAASVYLKTSASH